MSEIQGQYTPRCLSIAQQQPQDQRSVGHSNPSLSFQSLSQPPQQSEGALGSPFKIYTDENAPPSTAATSYTHGPLLEREPTKVHCCDVAEELLQRLKRNSKRKSKKRLEKKIRRLDFDIGEAERTLEYLDTERNRLMDEYTHCILRRTGKHHQRSDDSPERVTKTMIVYHWYFRPRLVKQRGSFPPNVHGCR